MKIKELFNLDEKSLKDPKTKYKIMITDLDEYGCVTNDSEISLTKIMISNDHHIDIISKMPASLTGYTL